MEDHEVSHAHGSVSLKFLKKYPSILASKEEKDQDKSVLNITHVNLQLHVYLDTLTSGLLTSKYTIQQRSGSGVLWGL